MDPAAPGVIQIPAGTLRAEVEIHDRQQLEVELAYPLLRDRVSGYSAEIFLFVPRNVGVSTGTYSKQQFYADLNAYLRMDSPPLTLADLVDPVCEASPLYHLDRALLALEADLSALPARPIVSLVRLFGHSFRESVRAARQGLEKRLQEAAALPPAGRAGAREELLAALRDIGEDGHEVLRCFRSLRRRFQPLAGARPESVREAFEHVDEHATSFLLEQLARLSDGLGKLAPLHDGSAVVAAGLCALSQEAWQVAHERRREGFSYPDPNRPRTAEFFTYRRGLLKKTMHQAFYLETRALRRDPYLRNAIAMVAAGLAAIWSLVAQVPATLGNLPEDTRFLMLGAAVVAYVLKDRIKDLSKEYLGRRLRSYDHDNVILGENLILVGLRGVSGRARERMRWTLPAQLPAPIVQLRTHPRTVAGSDISTEEVIAYQRTLSIGPEPGQRLPAGFALRDILRLNLQRFMARLDEPVDEVACFDLERRRFLRVLTPKVYHLNLVLRVCESLPGERPREVLLIRYRVVMNKERLLRIEHFQPGRGAPIGP